MRGILITFEGVEGSGKTTQAQMLYEHLRANGLEVILLREPGGTEIGERIREIILDPEAKTMDAKTELFLYLASRNQLVREKILPALNSGSIVLSDRFSDSSIAYQGYGRGLGARLVSRLNRIATCGLKPDLTLLIDVPVKVGSLRKQGPPDRLQQEKLKFHEEVRAGYLRLAKRARGRIKTIQGEKSPDEIQADIRAIVEEWLLSRGIPPRHSKRKGYLRK